MVQCQNQSIFVCSWNQELIMWGWKMWVNSESVFDVRFAKQRINDIVSDFESFSLEVIVCKIVCCSYVGRKLVNDVLRIYFAPKEKWMGGNHILLKTPTIHVNYFVPEENRMGKNHVSFWKPLLYICHLIFPQRRRNWEKNHVSFGKHVRYICHLFLPPKEDGMRRKSCILLKTPTIYM